jgi:hypothetical protein
MTLDISSSIEQQAPTSFWTGTHTNRRRSFLPALQLQHICVEGGIAREQIARFDCSQFPLLQRFGQFRQTLAFHALLRFFGRGLLRIVAGPVGLVVCFRTSSKSSAALE